MAKDPAFLFYPGDYLRDTQMLSEVAQVAYDRIMCEHMRNICITYQQHKFLTKRLNEDELEALNSVLHKTKSGFQIPWVVESINKRRAYSESRRKNREGKTSKHMLTYDKHMENENEIENENENKSMKYPTWEEFFQYARGKKPKVDRDALKKKYEYWSFRDWIDGKDQKIINWKNKLNNTLPYIEEDPYAGGKYEGMVF